MNWFIGTSGWSYKNWDKEFYPKGTKSGDKIKYYSEHFNAVEINASFYNHLKPSTCESWREQVPEGFKFAVKMHRYITQMKKLKADDQLKETLDQFHESIQPLGKKLGPILIQLPPSLKKDLDKMEQFLRLLPADHKYAIEFRNDSWFTEDTESLLADHNIALVTAHSPKWPMHITKTADFLYLRFHGKEDLFVSPYQEEDMKDWANRLDELSENASQGFAFFNNTDQGHAVTNAKQLENALERR